MENKVKEHSEYKHPKEFVVNSRVLLIDRLRILFGSRVIISVYVAIPRRGDEAKVQIALGFDKFFYKIGQAIKKSIKSLSAPAPDIKPLRGQRNQ